jgi:hypothetical protein
MNPNRWAEAAGSYEALTVIKKEQVLEPESLFSEDERTEVSKPLWTCQGRSAQGESLVLINLFSYSISS